MIGVNLIPAGIVQARKRKRHMRFWSVALVFTAAVSAVPIGLEIRQQQLLQALLEREQSAQNDAQVLSATLESLTQHLGELDERIARAEMLRTKRPWAGLLELIADSMTPKVWLTDIATQNDGASQSMTQSEYASTVAAAASAAGKKPNQAESESVGPIVLDGARRMSISGYAVDHEELYDFMLRLRSSSAFAAVDMKSSGREPVLQGQAVRFELVCTW